MLTADGVRSSQPILYPGYVNECVEAFRGLRTGDEVAVVPFDRSYCDASELRVAYVEVELLYSM